MSKRLKSGASVDALLLTFIKLVTTALGLVITRLLSQYLSIHDYGTYSQVLLVVSTVSSFTILGMMDGVNFFYCGEKDPHKREAYTATLFAFQCTVGTVAGCLILALSSPLSAYFDNPDVKRLVIFAAALPLLQNLLGMLQILLVSVGKAKILAIRNFLVSLVRLVVVIVVVTVVRNVALILTVSVLLDLGQIAFFGVILRKNNCFVRISKARFDLVGSILRYCAPMAVFTMVNSLNRDVDKYLISFLTDTETLAIYTNASKPLPFDIIMASFCTVLIPTITRLISEKYFDRAKELYKRFLEIAYISTGILCCAAISAAPQLMELLYSSRYSSGLTIFCIYIIVDLLRFTNITLVLSAAGKTKKLMFLGIGSLAFNAVLNVVMYKFLGISGPAIATLVTTVLLGVLMLGSSAKELNSQIRSLFNIKLLLLFIVESVVLTVLLSILQRWLTVWGLHYVIILAVICVIYVGLMILLSGRKLISALKIVNTN